MNKCAAFSAALCMALSFGQTVFAEDRAAVISADIEPEYEVVIPVDTTVRFGSTRTDFGSIGLTKACLESGYAVSVKLIYSSFLVNNKIPSETIPYSIVSADGVELDSAVYHSAGEKTPLFIDILPEAWKAAYAGGYSDTVVFDISYSAES